MAYKAIEIAKYIITYCQERGICISNLKLQKLLYYTWIDYYKSTSQYLFDDEICAWQFGPVVPGVYYEFCSYAGISISLPYECKAEFDQTDKRIIDSTLSTMAKFTASELVRRTHCAGTPWDIVFHNNGDRSVIPFSLIVDKECTL